MEELTKIDWDNLFAWETAETRDHRKIFRKTRIKGEVLRGKAIEDKKDKG